MNKELYDKLMEFFLLEEHLNMDVTADEATDMARENRIEQLRTDILEFEEIRKQCAWLNK